ncbi:MAG: hypothetical protein DYG98_07940 [Haliscomenobacteraceae bacterium CHB4]|nr:hypothetical protein [Haliscomenobacteraceae bacterium CHB4]
MASNTAMIFPLMLIRCAGLPLHWLEELAAAWPEENMPQAAVTAAVREAFDAALSALEASPLRTAVYNARRDFFQKGKVPAARFMQQLLNAREQPEIAQLIDLLNDLEKEQKSEEEKNLRYKNALHANYRVLQKAASEAVLQRSLLFASHDLLDRLPAFAKKPIENFNKKDRQTALSLLQYLIRTVAKTSPLSRFTTVALKRIGSQEESGSPDIDKSVVTPNVALLPALYEVLLREPEFYQALCIVLNPCIVRPRHTANNHQPSTGNPTLVWLYFDGENESFQQMERNPTVDVIVNLLLENGRKLPFPLLISRLKDETDATQQQLQSLVFELIDYGLLEWDLPEKGLSPAWCGGLYQFLGFLPGQSPCIVDAAALMQWLRNAARTLPFQPLQKAQAIQSEAVWLVRQFFEKYGGTIPPLTPEQIFYEDAETVVKDNVPDEAITSMAKDLAECWRHRELRLPSALRSQIFSFAAQHLSSGQAVDFLDFCRDFLGPKEDIQEMTDRHHLNTRNSQKIGALLQIFRDESGACRAVVNGLFPGGGKLYARWMHLFPVETVEMLKNWNDAIPFPWQGWSNANFQPLISKNGLAVPDGRLQPLRDGRQISLGNLAIQYETAGLQLIDRDTGEPVEMTDLGLEAPGSRPPAMQVLWHLGVPFVSLEALLPLRKWVDGGPCWRYSDRVVYGSLILGRKTWQVDAGKIALWVSAGNGPDFFLTVRKEMKEMGIPRQFFARFIQEKPQYFDLESPVSMLLFCKMLQEKKSPLVLSEMLPLPHQCVVQKSGLRASEYVLEVEV